MLHSEWDWSFVPHNEWDWFLMLHCEWDWFLMPHSEWDWFFLPHGEWDWGFLPHSEWGPDRLDAGTNGAVFQGGGDMIVTPNGVRMNGLVKTNGHLPNGHVTPARLDLSATSEVSGAASFLTG